MYEDQNNFEQNNEQQNDFQSNQQNDEQYNQQDTEDTVTNDYTEEKRYQYDPYTGAPNYSNYEHREEQPKKNKFNFVKNVLPFIIVIALIAGVIFGAKIALENLGFEITKKEETIPTAEPESETVETTERKTIANKTGDDSETVATIQILDVSDLVEKCLPSVVAVTDTLEYTYYSNYNPYYYFFGGNSSDNTTSEEKEANGSGVIIHQDEENIYIVTNNHVVDVTSSSSSSSSSSSYKVSLKSVTITFADGSTAEATVLGKDAEKDLAVVSVPISSLTNDTLKNISVATLGNSDDVKVGQGIIVIGNALGYGQSVTTGIISAKERTIEIDGVSMNLMQTDAAINPGNSGGGMFDANGRLIGINNSKSVSTSVEGMGFAIPITTNIELIEDLMNTITVPEEEAGYLGINGSTVPDSYVTSYGYPAGVVVNNIFAGSPADIAGLQNFDIITAVDGVAVTDWDSMRAEIAKHAAGTTITLKIQRPEKKYFAEMEIEVTLCSYEDLQALN